MSYCQPLGIQHSRFLNWAPEDRSKALAYKLEEASRCSMCGTADWEWEENRFAYEPVASRCHGCYLKDIANDTEQTLPGVTITLLPTSQISDEMRRGGKD